MPNTTTKFFPPLEGITEPARSEFVWLRTQTYKLLDRVNNTDPPAASDPPTILTDSRFNRILNQGAGQKYDPATYPGSLFVESEIQAPTFLIYISIPDPYTGSGEQVWNFVAGEIVQTIGAIPNTSGFGIYDTGCFFSIPKLGRWQWSGGALTKL